MGIPVTQHQPCSQLWILNHFLWIHLNKQLWRLASAPEAGSGSGLSLKLFLLCYLYVNSNQIRLICLNLGTFLLNRGWSTGQYCDFCEKPQRQNYRKMRTLGGAMWRMVEFMSSRVSYNRGKCIVDRPKNPPKFSHPYLLACSAFQFWGRKRSKCKV